MSMSFYPAILADNCMSPVFDMDLTSAYLPFDYSNPDADPVDNPKYDPELDVNLANGNAAYILQHMGYDVEEGCWDAEILAFKKTLEETLGDYETMMVLGEYGDRICKRLQKLVERGLTLGATHIYAA